MTTKCCWCEGHKQVHTLEIEDRSEEEGSDGSAAMKIRVCEECLTTSGLFCSKHQCVKLAIYDSQYQNAADPKAPVLLRACVACAAEEFEALDPNDASGLMGKILERQAELVDRLVEAPMFDVPPRASYERIFLFNLMIIAHLHRSTIEKVVDDLVAEEESMPTMLAN